MEIRIIRLGLDELCGNSTFSFDDPHGICRINKETVAAFRENPFRQTGESPAWLVGTVDGCAAGTLMFVPGEIFVDGKAFSVAWCSGLYVVPEYRGTLLGIALVREARGSYDVVGGSRVSDSALPIFKRLGWLGIPLTRFVMPCKSKPVLTQVLGHDHVGIYLSPLIDQFLILHRLFLKAREKISCGNLYLKSAGSMTKTLDAELTELNKPYGCHRSSRWLNWILKNSFELNSKSRKHLYFVQDRQERVVAYFVTRVKFHEQVMESGLGNLLAGSVLDWGIFDSSVVQEKQICLMATNTLTAQGVDVIEICMPSPAADVPFGFRRFGQHWMVLLSNSREPTISNNQITLWRLRQIDGDSGLV